MNKNKIHRQKKTMRNKVNPNEALNVEYTCFDCFSKLILETEDCNWNDVYLDEALFFLDRFTEDDWQQLLKYYHGWTNEQKSKMLESLLPEYPYHWKIIDDMIFTEDTDLFRRVAGHMCSIVLASPFPEDTVIDFIDKSMRLLPEQNFFWQTIFRYAIENWGKKLSGQYNNPPD